MPMTLYDLSACLRCCTCSLLCPDECYSQLLRSLYPYCPIAALVNLHDTSRCTLGVKSLQYLTLETWFLCAIQQPPSLVVRDKVETTHACIHTSGSERYLIFCALTVCIVKLVPSPAYSTRCARRANALAPVMGLPTVRM